jgi:phosphatidylserine decarboxylase precursor-related protein
MTWTLVGLILALMTCLPLAWKWQLGIRRTATVVVIFASLSAALVAGLREAVALTDALSAAAVWLLTVGSAFLLLAFRFYRDPDRQPPISDDVIVSPADGEVIYIRKSEGGSLPVSDKHGNRYPLAELTKTRLHADDAVVIGIAMNFADVHVNRAPIAGRITFRRHFPGRFGSLRKPEMVFENERATTVIDGRSLQVAVVQIASRLVRQIAVFHREGEAVALGQRLGVIRLGSQVDLVVPARADLRITTRIGEYLRAGESIVAVLEPAARSAPAEGALPRAKQEQSPGALVIAEHCRGLGLVRSLGRRGIPVWTLEPEGQRLASTSKYTRRSFVWPDSGDGQRLDYLRSLAERHQLSGWALFASDDETTAFIARHHAELSEYFHLTVPPWDVFEWAYDKRLTNQLAAEIGIDLPTTWYARTREEVAALNVRFPVILKPAFKKEVNPFTRDKAWRADDRETLIARYEAARALVGADVVMIQELIPGGGETQFSHAVLCVGGRTLASVTARRTRQYPVDFGHSSSLVETVSEPAVEEAATRLLAAMRYTGLAEVEFKLDPRDGRYTLLEINPRVWTWHALCGAAGVDFPYLLWQAIHDEPVPPLRGRPGVRWVRMSTDVLAAITEMRRGYLTLGAYARSVTPPVQFSTFASDDPAPALVGVPLATWSRIKRGRAHPTVLPPLGTCV